MEENSKSVDGEGLFPRTDIWGVVPGGGLATKLVPLAKAAAVLVRDLLDLVSAEARGAPAGEGVTLLVRGSSSLFGEGEGERDLARSLFFCLLLFFLFFL